MKRIVTGHKDGKSVIIESGSPDHVITAPGIIWNELWATFTDTQIPLPENYKETQQANWTSVFPTLGETRVRIVSFDPAQLDIESEESAAAMQRELPGLIEHMEVDDPGMHTTDSVDYGIVLEGRITLELDDGVSEELEAGDIVIQNGTRHAWRYTEKVTIAWILIGVSRSE